MPDHTPHLSNPAMHYLSKHWGEANAEQTHEHAAIEAISHISNTPQDETLIIKGIQSFLDSLHTY